MTEELTKEQILEQHFIKQIESVIRQMDELRLEKLSLERMLLAVKKERAILRDVVRRNSAARVLIEKAITEALVSGPLEGQALLKHARRIDFNLKEVTFRSYLHRMKQQNRILNSKGKRGVWALNSDIQQSIIPK